MKTNSKNKELEPKDKKIRIFLPDASCISSPQYYCTAEAWLKSQAMDSSRNDIFIWKYNGYFYCIIIYSCVINLSI
jgi:hypothetical protein